MPSFKNPSYTPWILKMSHVGLDELNEENGKRIKQQNGKGGASSDSYHENPLSLMLKDTHLV